MGAYGLSPKMQGVEDKTCPVLTKDLSWILSTNFRWLTTTSNFSSRGILCPLEHLYPPHVCAHRYTCAHVIFKRKRGVWNIIRIHPGIRHLLTLILSGILFYFRLWHGVL